MIEIARTAVRNMEEEYRWKIGDIIEGAINLEPEESFCPQCSGAMKVQKTSHRCLKTIKYGFLDLRIKTLICKGEAGSGTLFVAYTSWRGWVLGSWRLTTECADQIKPCLHTVAERFGIPCAIMRDFGRAIIPAANNFVEDIKEDVEILGCHSHFLKDAGKDLLEPSYDDLRKLFRSY